MSYTHHDLVHVLRFRDWALDRAGKGFYISRIPPHFDITGTQVLRVLGALQVLGYSVMADRTTDTIRYYVLEKTQEKIHV